MTCTGETERASQRSAAWCLAHAHAWFWSFAQSYAIIMWEVLSRQIPYDGNWFLFFSPPSALAHSLLDFVDFSLTAVCVCVSDVSNPMKIMFNVLRGMRPDTGYGSLSHQIPGRETLVCLMTCGWTADPDQRPSFLSEHTHAHARTRLFKPNSGLCVGDGRVCPRFGIDLVSRNGSILQ